MCSELNVYNRKRFARKGSIGTIAMSITVGMSINMLTREGVQKNPQIGTVYGLGVKIDLFYTYTHNK